eukprot:718315-Prymnesium_polylepis.1
MSATTSPSRLRLQRPPSSLTRPSPATPTRPQAVASCALSASCVGASACPRAPRALSPPPPSPPRRA